MSTQKFTFYKNNRTDQEFDLTEEQLRDQYRDFLEKKEDRYIEYYWPQLDNIFVMEQLEAVSEPEEKEELKSKLEELRKSIWDELKETES